jgi:pSer/pThr/pTyr-binding forkhead associated (FHA) protein/ferredoxin
VALLADGTPADEFPLAASGSTTIGRVGAAIVFPNDSMLSDQHALISQGANGLELQDLGSSNGVFVKVVEGQPVPFDPGTIVKAGRQWLIAQDAPGADVVQCDASGRDVSAHGVADGGSIVFGRAAPSVVLDASDTTLSRRHLSVSKEGGRLRLRDLGSRNGTFIKVDGRWPLRDGDVIWMGNQQLRLETGAPRAEQPAVVEGRTSFGPIPVPIPTPPPSPAAPDAKPQTGAMVTFGSNKPVPYGSCATLLDLALAKRVRIKYECKVGDCLKCRVEIKAGAANLNPRTAQEEKGLKMIGHPEAESRLACLVTRVTGPVVVQVPK